MGLISKISRPLIVLAGSLSTVNAWNYLFTGPGYSGPDRFDDFISVEEENDYNCYNAGIDLRTKPSNLWIEVPSGEPRAPKYMAIYGKPFQEVVKLEDKFGHFQDPEYYGCTDDNLFAIAAWYQGFSNLQDLAFPFYNNQLAHIQAIDMNGASDLIKGLIQKLQPGQGDIIIKNIFNGDWTFGEGVIDLLPIGVFPPRYRGGDNWVTDADLIRAEDVYLQQGNGPSGYLTDTEYKRGQDRVRRTYNNYASPKPDYLNTVSNAGLSELNSVIQEAANEDEGLESAMFDFNLGQPEILPAANMNQELEIEDQKPPEELDPFDDPERYEEVLDLDIPNERIFQMTLDGTINELPPKIKAQLMKQWDERSAAMHEQISQQIDELTEAQTAAIREVLRSFRGERGYEDILEDEYNDWTGLDEEFKK
ncbi:hypothetical protein H072_2217 [Dactylellina haptotyla CBS 200.50]|uniref:Uncharacterized protein n=1 Tax=Dactylellina haptotyla (strain CBS 200.50) TaxID=1284197 RepID=S8C7R4_DACHA|nr:hypothetical protein H072_2217 [Dactylellina haptotyla CBS 200.50]